MFILDEHIQSKVVCVFPTEVARRSHLIDYALHSEDGVVAAESALSFDTFRSRFLPSYSDRIPANDLIRFIFATEFVEEGNEITSFYNPTFPESKQQVLSFLSSLLPTLKEVLTTEIGSLLPRTLFQQLHLLYGAYTNFLEKNNLFEPQYEPILLPSEWDEEQEFRILYSDLLPEAQTLTEQLGSPSWLKLIPTPRVEKPTIEVYANHLQEIRSTLRLIRNLLDEGKKSYEIMITLANSDELLATLEDEAHFYGIPLVVHQGQSPLESSAGRFFSLIQDVYSDHFSLTSLKNLLLEPAIPWKDKELIQRFILFSLDHSILYGSASRPDHFEVRLSDPTLRVWYTSFRSALSAIVQANTIGDLLRALAFFRDTFWEESQWVGKAEEKIFAHSMNQIEKIDQALKASGREKLDGLYQLFVSHLQKSPYVPQQQEQGISVYRWPQGATITSSHRFFLGLDQDGSEVIDDPFSFLPEHVQRKLVKRKELGRFFLQAAALGNSTLSCHRRSNSGEKLVHFTFLEEGEVRVHHESALLDQDPLTAELKGSATSSPTYLQRQSFERSAIGSLIPRTIDHTSKPIEEALRARLYQEGSEQLLLSATGIDRFANCPYTYLARYLYKIDPQDYTEAVIDHRTIGTLLHDTYEIFFQSIGSFNREKVGSYKIELQKVFDEALQRIYGTHGPSISVRQWIIYSYRTLILSILEEELIYFEDLISREFEKSLSWVTDGVTLRGRIDRIVEMGEKQVGVIDFKKGGAVAPITKDKKITSYQLLTYQALIENSEFGTAVLAAYYSVKDGKYKFLYKADETETQEFCRIALEAILNQIKEAVKTGTFGVTPSDKACSNCPFRALCRRRYSTG